MTEPEITPLPPAPITESIIHEVPPRREDPQMPRGVVMRILVPWEQLRAGDVVVCCDGTPWLHPRTVISAVADEHNTDHFWLRTLEVGEEVPKGGAIYNMRFQWLVERRCESTGLEDHAERELRAAGLFDADSDYEGGIGHAVMDLVRAFAGRGHSGGSAYTTLEVFDRVARWQALTPISCKADEWMDVADVIIGQQPATLWQSKRDPALFSVDGGRSYYHVDERDLDKPPRCGAPLRVEIIEGAARRLYTSYDPDATPPTITADDQPAPVGNAAMPTWERVIEMCTRWASGHPIDRVVLADMRERDRVGRARYGTPLQPFNGRDSLTDLYQEQLDAIAYLANAIVERGEELDTMTTQLGEMLWRTIAHASTIRQLIMERAGEDPFARHPDGSIDNDRIVAPTTAT